MGLYIPPGGGSNSNSSGSSNSSSGSGKDGLFPTGRSNKIEFYTRPSVGLKIWGPFVPASDCLPGLYGLTALQTVMGLVMWRTVRVRWNDASFWGRLTKLANTAAGSYILFNSGLEFSRLSLPYDPWYEEARAAREAAEAHGKKVNWWFGPWDFKPMGFDEWNVKIDRWILEQEGNIERQGLTLVGSPEIKKAYINMRQINAERHSEILQQLNSGSFKDILPNYRTDGTVVLDDKPDLLIPPGNELEDDFDLDEVWAVNEPWDVLGRDTDIIVRFIP